MFARDAAGIVCCYRGGLEWLGRGNGGVRSCRRFGDYVARLPLRVWRHVRRVILWGAEVRSVQLFKRFSLLYVFLDICLSNQTEQYIFIIEMQTKHEFTEYIWFVLRLFGVFENWDRYCLHIYVPSEYQFYTTSSHITLRLNTQGKYAAHLPNISKI